MYRISLKIFVYILSTFLHTHAVLSYVHLSLDSGEVCSPITKRHLKLFPGIKSGMIFTQNMLSNHRIDWDLNAVCKFQVKLQDSFPRHSGIFAVLQTMELRRNETTQKCIDYIQFKRKNGVVSDQICGKSEARSTMSRINIMNGVYTAEANNTFTAADGELDVIIFIDKRALTGNEQTNITLVATAYKPCAKASDNDRLCGATSSECIFKEFINDSYFNCPYIDCIDEGGCSSRDGAETSMKRESIGNKVLIGSVTTMVLTFAVFICCIYICRKYDKFCWSEEFAAGSPSITNISVSQSPTTPQTIASSEPETRQSSHHAEVPTFVATAPSTADDKDLPPSYESLFPGR